MSHDQMPPTTTFGTLLVSAYVRPCPEMSENVRTPEKSRAFAKPDTADAWEIDELPHTQLAAIRLLLAGRKVSAIARELGIDPRTLYRWRQAPAFAAAFKRRQEQLYQQMTATVRGGG
jgi:hypothetical protein